VVDTAQGLWLNQAMSNTKTITAAQLQVGDIVTEAWGTVLTNPVTITSMDISPTYGGGAVRHSGGGIWPVRKNDTRPVVVQA